MLLPAKCPKCERHITSFGITGVDGNVWAGASWKCIALCCPGCQAVLGAQIDPIAIKTDIIEGLLERLRKSS